MVIKPTVGLAGNNSRTGKRIKPHPRPIFSFYFNFFLKKPILIFKMAVLGMCQVKEMPILFIILCLNGMGLSDRLSFQRAIFLMISYDIMKILIPNRIIIKKEWEFLKRDQIETIQKSAYTFQNTI